MSVLDPNVTALLHALMRVPDLKEPLSDRVTRLKVYRAMQAAEVQFAEGEHTLGDCKNRLRSSGWNVTRTPNSNSQISRSNYSFGPDTQMARLLGAYVDAGPEGLTDDRAAEKAGLGFGVASSPWRRSTDLRTSGLIIVLEDSEGNPILRKGLRGSERMVSVATPEGIRYIQELS